MNLQEFENELRSIRKETEEKVDKVRKSFLDSFPLKKGDKIKNKETGEIYVFSCIRYNNIFSPMGAMYAFKMKMDGTPSKVEKWLGSIFSIDSIFKNYEIISD